MLFLGRLQDLAGSAQREVPLQPTLDALIASFPEELAQVLRSDKVRAAVNGVLGAVALADGDEVAFLPPVSGG